MSSLDRGSSYIRNRLRLFYAELTLIYKLCGFFVYEAVGVPDMAPPTGAVNLFSHISHQIV
ncbi:hypothetical protein BWD12_12130 [Leptospira santarosai serovar Bananal]|nr:hypothetical protein BWD11_10530 [Leptospira santarosai serovar Grippotyphosa]ONF78466.1 hypothetical protein BWD12_12130 [Leptospira santarosai serovar Bananal]ONF85085.1 hypothetical protein BWD13_14470 [Leptospira santarosai serovar Grippotyphosa]